MLNQLKQRKERLSDELKDHMKKKRKESELNTIRSQIAGLETRLKYSINDRDNLVSVLYEMCVIFVFRIQRADIGLRNKYRRSLIGEETDC